MSTETDKQPETAVRCTSVGGDESNLRAKSGAGGEFEVKEREMLNYINATPLVLSLLYDIDMMPEQIVAEAGGWEKRRTQRRWFHMLIIAKALRYAAGEETRRPDEGSSPTDQDQVLAERERRKH